MDGIYAIGTTFDLSYTQTYATLAGAGAADQALLEAGGTTGDSVERAQAYDSPDSLANLLGGAMDDQLLGMMIALIVLQMLLGQDPQQAGGSMEDMLAMLGQALGSQQPAGADGDMMATQSMTLSFSYESISLGTQTPAFDSYGLTDVMA